MLYGSNFLPTSAYRYDITNGTMVDGHISFNANGLAAVGLISSDISSIPANLLLTVICDNFTNKFTPTFLVRLTIVDTYGKYYYIYSPVVETEPGIFTAELTLTPMSEYTSFIFSLYSAEAVNISSWSLAAPLSSEAEDSINEIEQKIPNILYDYNIEPITVAQEEVTVGLIVANLLDNASLNGHFLMTCTATANCLLTIRAIDNGITELFAPLVYSLSAGLNQVSIAHAYLEKIIGFHSFAITAQVSTGSISVEPRNETFTIDGGSLALRLMNVGMDVQDLSMRQLSSSDTRYVYAVGLDNANVQIRRRPYSENAAVGWEPIAIITDEVDNDAIRAAIEFEGHWAIDGDLYSFYTETEPWVMWIDDTGNLYAQPFIDDTSRETLASNCTELSTVKGYLNEALGLEDQGLIVAYISNGYPYYRNRTKQLDDSYIWEPAVLIKHREVPKIFNLYLDNPVGGTYNLEGTTLPYDATAQQVEDAINNSQGAGTVIVTVGSNFTITCSTDAGDVVLAVDFSGLIGSPNPALTVTQEYSAQISTPESIQCFRLNDYRIGISITDIDGVSTMLITERNWAGLGIRPEVGEATSNISIDRQFISSPYGNGLEVGKVELTALTLGRKYALDPIMEKAYNIDNGSGDYGIFIIVEFDENVLNASNSASYFRVFDANGYYYNVFAVTYSEQYRHIKLECSNLNYAESNDITVEYISDSNGLVGEAGQVVTSQSVTFTPVGLVFPPETPPVVVTIINVEGDDLD